MVVKVSEIEEMTEVKGTLEGSFLPGANDERFPVLAPLEYDLKVEKFDDRVRIQGPVRCELRLQCSRCVDEFPLKVEGYLDVELAPRDAMPRAQEVELRGKELDVEYYEGDEIDITPLVREEILLNLPVRPLCRDECKGLCERCGLNRNHGDCQCGGSRETVLGEKLKSYLSKRGA